MAGNFQIEGLEPALAKMKNLSQKMQAKGVRSAATKAMRIVRDAARGKARAFNDPKSAADIAKNIVTRNDTKGGKRIGGVLVKVGVQGGARPQKGRADTGHWRYWEFGLPEHNIPATGFMRKSLEGNVDRVTTTFVGELNKQIDKIIAKGSV